MPLAYSEEAVQTGSGGMAARREPKMLALQSEASLSVPTEGRKGVHVEDRNKHHAQSLVKERRTACSRCGDPSSSRLGPEFRRHTSAFCTVSPSSASTLAT